MELRNSKTFIRINDEEKSCTNKYKYSGNFWINGNTHLAAPMSGNNKRELFRRLRAAAERELAKGYRLYIQVIDNRTLDVAAKKHYQF